MPFNANATNNSVVYVSGDRVSSKVLTADQTVTSSTTLVEVPALTLSLGKYERIAFRYSVWYSCTANSDIKYLVDVPASITLYRLSDSGSVDHAGGEISNTVIAAEGSAITIAVSGTEGFLNLNGMLENGSASADLKFTFANGTSHADGTTVRRGSNIEYVKF